MTEKRFILTETSYIYDNQDKGICPTLESVVKVLNELHEENKKLKQRSRIRKDDYLETLNDLERAYENNRKALSNIERLEEEKEKLKKENKRLKHDLNDTEKELQEYKDFMSLG